MNELPSFGLNSVRVWVTRSEAQAGPLCALLEQAGAQVVMVPVLTIEGPDDPATTARSLANALAQADLAVFISRNAVDWTWRLLGPAPGFRAGARILAVGPATAAELRNRGISEVLLPRGGADTEAMLALPVLGAEQVAGRHVVIVRGVGGRALLGDTLRARGAQVEYVEIYRRASHPGTRQRLPDLWREQPPQAIVVSSPDGLQALIDMSGRASQNQLYACPVLAIGDHLARQAIQSGFHRCYPVPAAGGDSAVLEVLARSIQDEGMHEQSR